MCEVVEKLVFEGRAEGRAEGLAEGLDRALKILMQRDGRTAEYESAKSDSLRVSELLKEYGLVD